MTAIFYYRLFFYIIPDSVAQALRSIGYDQASVAKPDYDAIEIFREKQAFFKKALHISGCPSAPANRQRTDLIGDAADRNLKEASASLIKLKCRQSPRSKQVRGLLSLWTRM